jgi:acyl carrier protein
VVPVAVAGFTQLAAYVVPQGEAPDIASLHAHLRAELPEYMVPAFFTMLSALPLTRNGKLERAALPDPVASIEHTDDNAARSPQEQVIADIWASCLGVPGVGLTANFFDVGGHSLLATKVMSRIRSAFAVELPLQVLFKNPTVTELAGAVELALAAQIDAMTDDEVAAAVHGLDRGTRDR